MKDKLIEQHKILCGLIEDEIRLIPTEIRLQYLSKQLTEDIIKVKSTISSLEQSIQSDEKKSVEKIIDSLYEFMRPFFVEVGDYCRRGHVLEGRKMSASQIYSILGRIKKAIAEREFANKSNH